MSMFDIVIAGGGAAGLMAAVIAAREGRRVCVLEPNAKTGRKLRITGKGRCNVTSDSEPREFLAGIRSNPKFLRSALYAFPPSAAMAFFEELGVALKTERGARVFPVSDSADEVADALERAAREAGAVFSHERLRSIRTAEGRVAAAVTERREIECSAVILCTGGLSYPGTGSTGEGYRIARALGHTVKEPRASLVPLEGEELCRQLQGLTLRNVELSLFDGDKLLYREQGELLFTHFGVSGPLALTASTYLSREDLHGCRLELDLKPALSEEKLDERLLRDFGENQNRDFINALDALLPQKLIPVVVERSGIPPRMKVNSITRAQRRELLTLLKRFPIRLTRLRPIAEAIITAGGVDVTEVDPRSMESKLVPGLYFAGEVLDIDGRTGGYNLQIAWSTAHAAALHAGKERE